MRTIAILLCDNDFGNTFIPLLESIYNLIKWHEEDITEAFIKQAIMEAIGWHYCAYQHHAYFVCLDIREPTTITYLKNKVKVLFDTEAEKAIQELGHNSGSWYLEIQTGKIYSF